MRRILVGGAVLGMCLLAPQAARADEPVRAGVLIQPYIQIGAPAPVVRREVVVVKEPHRYPPGWYRRHHPKKDRVVYVVRDRHPGHSGHPGRHEGWRK